MSNICIVNLKDNNINNNVKILNRLSKELIQYSLDNNIAVFFNSYDYGEEIINEAKMKCFFLMSDSFIYKNCEFLSTNFLMKTNNKNIEKVFLKKYQFFEDVLKIIFKYDVSLIEIFISVDGAVNCVEDFNIIKSSRDSFLIDLYKVFAEDIYDGPFCFPTVKFEIQRN